MNKSLDSFKKNREPFDFRFFAFSKVSYFMMTFAISRTLLL